MSITPTPPATQAQAKLPLTPKKNNSLRRNPSYSHLFEELSPKRPAPAKPISNATKLTSETPTKN